MKKFSAILLTLFIVSAAIFSGCKTQSSANGNSGNANSNAVNSQTGKVDDGGTKGNTSIYPEMTANIMKAEIKALEGDNFKLADLKGKIVLVNLWAVWCGPCKIEMPELSKIEKEYADKGFMVVGLDVDQDDSAEAVKSVISKLQVDYKMGWINSDAEKGFIDISRMQGIPQSFLITRDGRLAAVYKGYNPQRTVTDLKAKIEEVLAKDTQ